MIRLDLDDTMPWYDLRPSWQQGSPSEEFAKSFQNARAATLLPLQVQQMQNQLKSEALNIANQSIQNQRQSAELDFRTRTLPDLVKQIEMKTRQQKAAWELQENMREAETDLATSMPQVASNLGSDTADTILTGVAARHPILLNSPAYQNAQKQNAAAKASKIKQMEVDATLNNRLLIAQTQADERLKAAQIAKEKKPARFFEHPDIPG